MWGDYELGFDRPWYLLLLLLLPVLAFVSVRSLSGLGRFRMISAIVLRSLVLAAIVFALAEIQMLKRTDRLTVIYLLDQSQSIPLAKRQAMINYAIKDVAKHRDDSRGDLAGVIVFGGEAKIEIPPFDDNLPSVGVLEGAFDLHSDSTSLEAALKLAKAAFPENSAGRVVIITDGNENLGDALQVARSLTKDGIGIDVVPVKLEGESEIIVEKIVLPSDIRKGQNFEARVVIMNHATPTEDNPSGIVRGKLTLFQETQQNLTAVNEGDENTTVELKPGKNVYSYILRIDHSGIHKYHATFTPETKGVDQISQNNQASAFTHVRGKGRVLLIENWQSPGEFDYLVQRLRTLNMEVDVIGNNRLFTSGAELLEYDSIVLANVPRAGDDGVVTGDNNANSGTSAFTDDQIRMLVDNTHDLGCGLVMIGGQDSFGAGGWINTDLEKAMPVDFQVKSKEIKAVGALVMVMHASEMPDGNYWQKKIAEKAIDTLGPMDYCGVVEWGGASGTDRWLWLKPNGIDRVYENRTLMKSRVNRMVPGDMPNFEPSMQLALSGFAKLTNASVKHMIIISDGDPVPPAQATLDKFKAAKIQISTVAVGTHGPPTQTPMKKIADATGGKFYVVQNPKALPGIYQREARRISRPLVFEPSGGVAVLSNDVSAVTGITQGIPVESLPRVSGYVLTELKEGGLVEQVLIADQPTDTNNSTLLATWRYGLGRATVFTSDAGHKWTTDWTNTEYYDKFFGQMIRHSMRPIKENANFSMATEVRDGKIRIVVNALDEDDQFLNSLNMKANVVGPQGKEKLTLDLAQKGPGRYEGEFAANEAGSYLFSVLPGDDYERLSSGVNVPFSTEYSDRETNEGLIYSLASLQPTGGEVGKVIGADIRTETFPELLETNTFRKGLREAVSSHGIWPLILILCGLLFFADVFVRRVQVGFGWVPASYAWVRNRVFGKESEEAESKPISRLQERKAELNRQLEEKRAATRFAPAEDAPTESSKSLQDVVKEVTAASQPTPPPTRKPPATSMTPGEQEEQSYTARLLAAKKRATKDRKDGN
jgi:uncharacterized membrane protein